MTTIMLLRWCDMELNAQNIVKLGTELKHTSFWRHLNMNQGGLLQHWILQAEYLQQELKRERQAREKWQEKCADLQESVKDPQDRLLPRSLATYRHMERLLNSMEKKVLNDIYLDHDHEPETVTNMMIKYIMHNLDLHNRTWAQCSSVPAFHQTPLWYLYFGAFSKGRGVCITGRGVLKNLQKYREV